MSNFSVSPTQMKSVGSVGASKETKFTNLIKASNQSRVPGSHPTKFSDLISSSNQVERQRETIATLITQVSELKKELNTCLENEKEQQAEQKIAANKLVSMKTVYENLSTDHSALQVQLQEAKDSLLALQISSSDQLSAREHEAEGLRRSVLKAEKENEEMLASWDALRVKGDEQTGVIEALQMEAERLKRRGEEREETQEALQSVHEALGKKNVEVSAERDSLRARLISAEQALAAIRASLSE